MTQDRRVLVLALLAIACSGGPDSPTDPDPTPGTPAGIPDAGYQVQTLDPVSGDNRSFAEAVNDAGTVVGASTLSGASTNRQRAFARIGGTTFPLTAGPGLSTAEAVSNGAVTYVSGFADTAATPPTNTVPVRWTVNSSGVSETRVLENAFGNARGLNDNGDVVGSASSLALMWMASGARIVVSPPSGVPAGVSGTGRDINNAGHSIFVFSSAQFARGYFRFSTGEMLELQPQSPDVMSYATAMGEVTNGIVFVSGVSATTGTANFRAIRWRVDLNTRTATITGVADYDSESGGVSDAGIEAVMLQGNQVFIPRIWLANGSFQALAIPSGNTSASVSHISPNGRHVVGYLDAPSGSKALLWTRP